MSNKEPKLKRHLVRTLSASTNYGGEWARFEVTADTGCGRDWLLIRFSSDDGKKEIMVPYDLQPLLAEAILDARSSSERDTVDIDDKLEQDVTPATDGLANEIADYLDQFGYIGAEELSRLKREFPCVLTTMLRDRHVWLWSGDEDSEEGPPIE